MRVQAIIGTDKHRIQLPWAIIGRLSGAFLIVIVSFIDFVPFSPRFPFNALDMLDSGWEFALNVAVAKGFIFGKDIVFTFGPYGSIYTTQYYPGTDSQMLWGGSLLAVAFSASLISLYDGTQKLAATGLAAFLVFTPRDTQLFAIPLITLLLVCRVALPVDNVKRVAPTLPICFTLALLVMSLSLLPLVKATFAIASGLVVVISCVLLFARGYRGLAIGGAALFGVTIAAFWVLSGQPLGCLPNFFLAQRPIVSGYTAAMSAGGPKWQIATFVVGGLLIGLPYIWRLNSADTADRVFYAGGAVLLFLTFKEGFVRENDMHPMVAAGMLAVVGWVAFLDRKGLVSTLSLAVGMLVWLAGDHGAHGVMKDIFHHRHLEESVTSAATAITSPFLDAGDGFIARLTDPKVLMQSYADSLAAIQARQPLPKLVGSTDIYSYGQGALLASGLQWSPRPVLQSYSAYTPSLALLDANYLASSKAPENILFAVQPIDGRLPALEDGASWPELLGGYDFVGLSGDLAILKRRKESEKLSSIEDVPFYAGTFQLGKPMALPGNIPAAWAQIDIRQTILGSLVALLFKPTQLNIVYFFPDGSKQTFRYIAGMGVSGFVVLPVVKNTAEFVALGRSDFGDYFAGRQPTSFMIDAGLHGRWLWRSAFSVRLFSMHLGTQPTAG